MYFWAGSEFEAEDRHKPLNCDISVINIKHVLLVLGYIYILARAGMIVSRVTYCVVYKYVKLSKRVGEYIQC